MVFFFFIPSIPAVLGNFIIPSMIGAKDVSGSTRLEEPTTDDQAHQFWA
jgi:heme/copper-type cytochrome/quinol oxidase subunit 1